MKKITLIVMMLIASMNTAFSQQNFWEGLDTTVTYNLYYRTYTQSGTELFEAPESGVLDHKLSFKLLPNKHPYDFKFTEQKELNPSDYKGNFDHRKEFSPKANRSTNNYSYPSMYIDNYTNYAVNDVYLVIDGCFIKTEIKDRKTKKATELTVDDISIRFALVPKEEKGKKKDPKKKLSLKERIAAAKVSMAQPIGSNASPRIKALGKNLKQNIIDYLVAMEKVQKAHPYTAADKAGMQQEEDIANGTDAYVKQSNIDFENSEEGKRYRRSVSGNSSSQTSYCTVKNEGATTSFISKGAVNAVSITAGSSYNYFEAGKPIHYSNNNGDVLGIAVSNCAAGKTYIVK